MGSAEKDPIAGGEFKNIPNGSRRWLCRSNRMVGSRNCRRHHELLESGRRKYKKIVILDIAGIAELMRDVARGQESVALPENKNILSYPDLELSGKNKVHFVLARMGMSGNAQPRCETYLQQAIGSSCIFARQTYGTEPHIKVILFGSRLMFD
jgi:hypothetical protein